MIIFPFLFNFSNIFIFKFILNFHKKKQIQNQNEN
jgi:hypothetical protein